MIGVGLYSIGLKIVFKKNFNQSEFESSQSKVDYRLLMLFSTFELVTGPFSDGKMPAGALF